MKFPTRKYRRADNGTGTENNQKKRRIKEGRDG